MKTKDIRKERFESITDQIDFYLWSYRDNKKLSSQQKQHLNELKNTVSVFGPTGEKWVNLCNELLKA